MSDFNSQLFQRYADEYAMAKAQENEKMESNNEDEDDIGEPIDGMSPQEMATTMNEQKMQGQAMAALAMIGDDESSSKVAEPLNAVLRASWIGFIPFGIFYINFHAIIGRLISRKAFCKLGKEWKIPVPAFVEYMGLVLADLLVICAVAMVVTVIVAIVVFNNKLVGPIYDANNAGQIPSDKAELLGLPVGNTP